MTPTQLRSIIQAATPGPWRAWDGFVLGSTDHECLASVVNCDGATIANRNAIVALRNHADALIECAGLLKELNARIQKAEDDGLIVRNTEFKAKVTAALARLEK